MVCRAYFKDKSNSPSKSKTSPKSTIKSNSPSKIKSKSQSKAAPKAHPSRLLSGEKLTAHNTICFYAVILLDAFSEDFLYAMASCLEHSGYIFTNFKRASKVHTQWKRTHRLDRMDLQNGSPPPPLPPPVLPLLRHTPCPSPRTRFPPIPRTLSLAPSASLPVPLRFPPVCRSVHRTR